MIATMRFVCTVQEDTGWYGVLNIDVHRDTVEVRYREHLCAIAHREILKKLLEESDGEYCSDDVTWTATTDGAVRVTIAAAREPPPMRTFLHSAPHDSHPTAGTTPARQPPPLTVVPILEGQLPDAVLTQLRRIL
jgi:hypothetical protein